MTTWIRMTVESLMKRPTDYNHIPNLQQPDPATGKLHLAPYLKNKETGLEGHPAGLPCNGTSLSADAGPGPQKMIKESSCLCSPTLLHCHSPREAKVSETHTHTRMHASTHARTPRQVHLDPYIVSSWPAGGDSSQPSLSGV